MTVDILWNCRAADNERTEQQLMVERWEVENSTERARDSAFQVTFKSEFIYLFVLLGLIDD
jgi:hypothetical protein